MKSPPPEVIASWPKPNYQNPETRGPAFIIVSSIFLGIATVLLLLRLYTRIIIKKWVGWDDLFIVLAYIFNVAVSAMTDVGYYAANWDRHIWDVRPQHGNRSNKQAYATKLLYLAAGFFTAQSILSFYYRLIKDSGVKNFRIVLHVSVILNLILFLPFLFTQIFVCVPVSAYWALKKPAGAICIEEAPVTLAGSIVKTFVDFAITTLPIPLIIHMKISHRQKLGVAFLLGLGYITTLAGAVRSYYVWKVFYDTWDRTWYHYPAFLAAAIELNLGIIAACIPPVRPLFIKVFGGPVSRLKEWYSSERSTSHSSSTATHNHIQLSSSPQSRNGSQPHDLVKKQDPEDDLYLEQLSIQDVKYK